jgi:PKD repeat protein
MFRHSQVRLSVLLAIVTLVFALVTITSLAPFGVYAQTTATVSINNGAEYTNSTTVALTVSALDAVEMRFSNDNSTWSDWEIFATSKNNWNLTNTEGDQTVYAQFQNSTGQVLLAEDKIVVDLTAPQPSVYLDWVSFKNREVFFDASYSVDNYGIVSFDWTFGDDKTGTGVTTTHAYAEPGNYTGTLTVKDAAGNIGKTGFRLTIPDISQATPTPTPTAAPTTIPTPTPTAEPTTTPSPTPTPTTSEPLTTTLVWIIVALIGVVIIVVAVVLVRRKPKT